MGNKFKVEVEESVEELKHRLCHAVTSNTRERVQMLYWVKQESIVTRKELAQKLGRDESTIYRWLKKYRQGGISSLLEVKTPPGKKSKIGVQEMNLLKEHLSQPQGFKSYQEIQEWLDRELGVKLAPIVYIKSFDINLKPNQKHHVPKALKLNLKFKMLLKKTERYH